MKKILFSLLILFTITGCAIAQEPAPTVPKPFIGQFFVNISGGDTSVYVYKGGAYGWTKLLRARGTSVIDTLHTKKGVSVAGNLNVGGNLSITGSGSNTLGQVIIGGGDWYGQLQLRSDGGGTSGAGRIRFSNTHSAGLDYFIQQDNDPSASSLIISRGTPGGTVGVKITDKNIYDGDGVRFLKTGDVTGGGTTTNNLTAGNGIIGTAFNGASAQTWKADTSILQTVLNFFPKADTRYLKTSTAASTYQPIGSYALQSITISPGLGLTGGGSIAANRTITVDTTVLKSKVGFLTDYNNLSGRINAKQASLTGPGYVKMASGSPTYITSIPNADLAFSTITLNGASTALGGSFTVTKTNTDTTTTGFATRSLVSTYLTKAQIVAGYQPLLVSATNIKTVNSASLLGSGNLAITTANTDTTSTGFQTVSNFFPKADTRYLKISTASTTYTPLTRNINTSSGITGGGALSADLTLKSDTTFNRTVANSYTLAALQTKFNNYTLQTRNISTGLGLSGGGTLAADRTIIADTTVLKSKTGFLTDYNNLSTRINAKGVGSVTSVAAGLGMSFTTITGAGSVIADTTVLRTVANSKSLAQLQTAFNLKANLASPALTGTPTAPTQATADNSTAIATTAYVQANFTASTVYFSPGTFSGAGTSGSPYAITLTTTGTSGAATFASGVLNIPQYSGGGATGASPTASLGLTAINGSATTFMRSDAAPALSQSIAPTWTGIHTWNVNNLLTATSDIIFVNNTTASTNVNTVQVSPSINIGGTYWTGSASNAMNYRITAGNLFGNQFTISGQTNGGTWKDLLYIDPFGAFISKSQFTIQLSNTGTTPTEGLILQSTTASSAGSPVQWSGRTRFISRVWNTTATAADNQLDFTNEVRPVSGTTPTGKMFWASRLSVSGSGSFVDNMSLDNSGNLRVGTITTSPLSLSAINATATATAAQVAIGYITSTSASATTITLPTATALATQLGAVRGTQFQFTIDNTLGASTVTLALGTGFTQLSILTGANTLTVASGATGVGVWEITFVSTTAATISRVE